MILQFIYADMDKLISDTLMFQVYSSECNMMKFHMVFRKSFLCVASGERALLNRKWNTTRKHFGELEL